MAHLESVTTKNISVKCKILLKNILSFLDKIFKIYVETTHCKCGVFLPKWDNKDGKKILAKKLHREEFEDYILTNICKDSLLVMEACGSCHYWSNRFMESGFVVKLLKPCDVKAFAKTRQKMIQMMLWQ